jgi:iron complex outermembrane receptor protein
MYDNMNDWNYLGQHTVDFTGTDILMSPSLVGMASATFRPFASAAGSLKSAYLTWNGKYVGRQFYDNTSSDERAIPDYFVADMSVGYSVPLGRSLGFVQDDTSLTFSFHIHNLFNHKYYADAWLWRAYFQQDDLYYAETGLYPQAPLNLMFKAAWNF